MAWNASVFFANINTFNFILMVLKFSTGVIYLYKSSNPGKKSYEFLYKGK